MGSLIIGVGNINKDILKYNEYIKKYSININDWDELNINTSNFNIIYLIVDYSNNKDVILANKIIKEIREMDNEIFIISICYNYNSNSNSLSDYSNGIACFMEYDIKKIAGIIMTIDRTVNIEGLINIDMYDLVAISKFGKKLVLGCGDASGNNRAIEACNNAMGNIDFTNVKSIIIIVIASSNLSLSEVNRAIEAIREKNKDIELIFGAGVDDSYGDKLEIRIIGFK